jgi:hypothetical protein
MAEPQWRSCSLSPRERARVRVGATTDQSARAVFPHPDPLPECERSKPNPGCPDPLPEGVGVLLSGIKLQSTLKNYPVSLEIKYEVF